jgi:hypothetical protein
LDPHEVQKKRNPKVEKCFSLSVVTVPMAFEQTTRSLTPGPSLEAINIYNINAATEGPPETNRE